GEGVIASDEFFKTEFDSSTTPGYFRTLTVLIYAGSIEGLKFPVRKDFEIQAADVGVAPSAPSDPVTVSFPEPTRAIVSFIINDGTAEHRVFRNEQFHIRLSPGNNSFVDDGLNPSTTYKYKVQAVKNGQTSEFAGVDSGGGGGGGGGTTGGGTCITPTM